MTTDFEAIARAEGRVLADEWMQKNGGPQTNGHHIAHTSIIYGFRSGASWAAAQEPTPGEIEAAAEGLARHQRPSRTWVEVAPSGKSYWRGQARAALAAARAMRAAR